MSIFLIKTLPENPQDSTPVAWITVTSIPIQPTTYAPFSSLDASAATTLISFINPTTPASYIAIHAALLEACTRFRTCKRLIPSEWIGDIEAFPLKPRSYAASREPFRKMLYAQTEVQWTLFNQGWLAKSFLPPRMTHLALFDGMFLVAIEGWTACIRDTGDEPQCLTAAGDVGAAVGIVLHDSSMGGQGSFSSSARYLTFEPCARCIRRDPIKVFLGITSLTSQANGPRSIRLFRCRSPCTVSKLYLCKSQRAR